MTFNHVVRSSTLRWSTRQGRRSAALLFYCPADMGKRHIQHSKPARHGKTDKENNSETQLRKGTEMIGIIGAMETEIAGIRERMTAKKEKMISGIKYVVGKLGGADTVTAVCGVGKVFAAVCAQTMILEYHPDIILNTGVAGALSPELSAMDIVVAEQTVQYDMDTSPLGDPKGYISGIGIVYFEADKEATAKLFDILVRHGNKAVKGVIASGDRFVASDCLKNFITTEFNAIACEMEGAAIAQVCYVNKCRFAVLRAISDGADGEAELSYNEFCDKAAAVYVDVVNEFAEQYGDKNL